MPHVNPSADVAQVASHMVSSGAFKAATVGPGGISATFADGSPAAIFADRIEDLVGAGTAPALARRSRRTIRANDALTGASTAHEIAFLVNEDGDRAFVPSRQAGYAAAFVNRGFPAAGYEVDVLDASLDNIAALATAHPLDVLDIATHGGRFEVTDDEGNVTNAYYLLSSTTPINDAEAAAYASDIAQGYLLPSLTLDASGTVIEGYGLRPEFITEHDTFNPGALVDNESCYGQYPTIASAVQATFAAANASVYMGWTNPVGGDDADESDAFLIDRLLGEQPPDTGMSAYISQRNPPQRPFRFTAVEGAMATENRDGPFGATGVTYDISPGSNGNADAVLTFSYLGTGGASYPPLFYALPSLEFSQVHEQSPSAILELSGLFPQATGSVTMSDGSQNTVLPIVYWSPLGVDVDVPDTGAGSSGLVTVWTGPGGTGIASNAVPLTQWTGSATLTDYEAITGVDSYSGTGSGQLSGSFNFLFRSDVAPVVTTIDTDPVTQNLAFNDIEGASTGSLSGISGSFKPNPLGPFGRGSMSFSQGNTRPIQPFSTALPSANYHMPAATGTSVPSSCNNASPGPQPGSDPDVSCRDFGLGVYDAIACSDDVSNGLCGPGGGGDFAFYLGGGVHPGVITLTMDPATYAITASVPTLTPFDGYGFYIGYAGDRNGSSTATETFNLTIGAPNSPPESARSR